MYTIENNFNEMKSIAATKGINTKGMNKATLINALNALEPQPETKKRGRPINPDSPRQQRLSIIKTGQRGRPADPNSAWNKRQAELKAKRETGELKLGRAINPTSARQKRLALKGTLPLGRPKAVKVEEVAPVIATETETSAN